MSDIAIGIDGLGKRYRIGATQKKGESIHHQLKNLITSPFNYLSETLRQQSDEETLWALRDVSFEVERGEVVGIIGRNGSGKSTLLKILSRITEPTTGRAEVYGSISSLLEVGTGFHPELTGRENVFLSGSILGMKKKEIEDKFDEIAGFSGIEKFLDTPVKRYSRGMYVRLGFAVAANLDSEILLVDEVLAVGDAAFQKKCLGTMRSAAKEGRTVLFVSHNMGTISQLCSRAILIEEGRLVNQGSVRDIVSLYLNKNNGSKNTSWMGNIKNIKYKNEILDPLRLSLKDKDGCLISDIVSKDMDVYVELEFLLHRDLPNLTVGIALFNQNDTMLFITQHTDGNGETFPKLKIGRNILRMKLPMEILNVGDYKIALACCLHYKFKWLFNPFEADIYVKFEVVGGVGDSLHQCSWKEGLIAPKILWDRIDT